MKKKTTFGSSHNLTGEIIAEKQIIQTFTAESESLSGIGVEFGTYKRKNAAIILLEIIDFDDVMIKSCALNSATFKDNAFHIFDMPCILIKGKQYILKISSVDASIGNSVTAKWGRKFHVNEKFCIDETPKLNGELSCRFIYDDEIEVDMNVNRSMGLVSVIIPILNGSELLGKTLQSIKQQTYNFLEVFIVNDGSSPEESEKIKQVIGKFPDLKIELYESEINKGACFARNFGANKAKGEYLFFCDADVDLDKTIFQKMIQALHIHTDCSWAYCNFMWGNKQMSFRPFCAKELRKRNLCSTMSLIKALDFPGFTPDLKRLQDWDLFLKMNEKGKIGIWLNDYLFTAEERQGITSNSITWEQAVAELRKKHPTLGT